MSAVFLGFLIFKSLPALATCDSNDPPVIPFLGAVKVISAMAPEACREARDTSSSLHAAELKWQRDNPFTALPAEILRLRREYEKSFRRCEESVHQDCFAALATELDLERLKKMFGEWIRNDTFRMPTAGIHCFHRAYLLAEDLAKQGLQSRLVRINSRGPLIGLSRDSAAAPNGFYNYGRRDPRDGSGSHWVVEVSVAAAGTQEKFILDPQFFDEPLPARIYFRRITGTDCDHAPEAAKAWCSFERFSPNALPREEDARQGELFVAPAPCRFSRAQGLKREIDQINALKQYGGGEPLGVRGSDLNSLQEKILQREWGKLRKAIEARLALYRARPKPKEAPYLPDAKDSREIIRELEAELKNLPR